MMKKHIHTWNRLNLIMLFERLEMYTSAGLTLHAALSAASSGVPKKQSYSLDKAIHSIENGGSLSRTLHEQLKISPTITGLIEHGEAGGDLSRALGLAKILIEREDTLIRTCMSAMAYPTIIGIFAILLTVGLMRGVMPQIIPLLKSLHVELPMVTRIVIFLSENLLLYGIYIVCAITVIIPLSLLLYRKVNFIRTFCHKLVLSLPIAGRLARYYSLSLMMRSLGALISSGAASADSYARVVSNIPLIPMRVSFNKECVNISRGVPLGTVLSKIKRMPLYVAPLVSAGEASGSLGNSLTRAADILDRDIEHMLKRLTALVEPVMMAGMGCAVGTIALSIMMPIYDVSKALQH